MTVVDLMAERQQRADQAASREAFAEAFVASFRWLGGSMADVAFDVSGKFRAVDFDLYASINRFFLRRAHKMVRTAYRTSRYTKEERRVLQRAACGIVTDAFGPRLLELADTRDQQAGGAA